MAKQYSDIGKDAKDLITKEFPADGAVRMEVRSKTPEGIAMTATLDRTHKAGAKESVKAVFEPKYEFKDPKVEVTGKISTANEFTGGFSARDLVTAGTKLEVSGTQSERDGASTLIGASFKTNLVYSKLLAKYPFSGKKKPEITAEIVAHYPSHLQAGATIRLDVDPEKVTVKGDGIISYSQDNWEFALKGSHSPKDDQTIWGISFFHRISLWTKWGLDFDADHAWQRGPIANVAGEYKLDDATTLKGKWNVKLTSPSQQTELRLDLSAKQKLSQYVTATIGSDLNVRSLLGSDGVGDAHSFGLELKFDL